MSVPEKRNMGAILRRIVLLQKASDVVGQAALAEAIGISPRALRHKLSVDRGVADTDLQAASTLLDQRADALAKLGASIREVMA